MPNAASFPQMLLSFLIAGLVGSLQADQTKQRRGLSCLNSQCRIGRIVSEFLARMVIVIPLQHEGTEDTIQRDRLWSFALFSGFGLRGSIDLLRSGLQKEGDQRGSWFEN